ncbi:MAG: CRTAC1 family protein [Caldilineaceae bacterium]
MKTLWTSTVLCRTIGITGAVLSLVSMIIASWCYGPAIFKSYLLATAYGQQAAAGVTTPGAGTFSDHTVAANLAITHTTYTKTELNMMISGAAAGDFNNDGWQDLFVLGGGATADALYINQQDGSFREEGAAWGLADHQRGSGAAVGDYNNDGWLDIFVTSHGITETASIGHHRLYRNNHDGSFTDVAQAAGVNQSSPTMPDGFGASFGDYDLDGDLDLFVTGWQQGSKGNRLFRNNGNGTFSDVTNSSGAFNSGLRGFSPCFADMNGDRYPELLVAGDFSTTKYFVNNGNGSFTDQSVTAGVAIPIYGMGSTVADLNNDGRLDWYVTSIYHATFGGEGNRLFINQGNDQFVESAAAAGTDNGRWGWGTAAVDLNHDGWVDIAETNGWPLEAQFRDQPARLWMNQGNDHFSEEAAAAGLDHNLDGRGLLAFDYDNDGDEDIVITSNNGRLYLFRNEITGSDAHWLRIFLDTSQRADLAPNGIGARVQVSIGGNSYVRTIQACANYLSQSELSAHFGLGSASVADEVRVEWPNGEVTTLTNIDLNQTLTIAPSVRFYLPIIATTLQ